MRRFVALLALLACAPPNPSDTEVTPRQATILADDRILKAEPPRAAMLIVAATPASVWTTVRKVYQALEIPVTTENPSSRQIGNANFWKQREIGGEAMSHYVDCGTGMTGVKANSYRIYMSLLTVVAPDGQGGTRLETTFVPMGQDVTGGSMDRIPCGTTGRLESLINTNVRDNTPKK